MSYYKDDPLWFKRGLFRLLITLGQTVSVYVTPSFALVINDRDGRLSNDQLMTLDELLRPSTFEIFRYCSNPLSDHVIYHMPLDEMK